METSVSLPITRPTTLRDKALKYRGVILLHLIFIVYRLGIMPNVGNPTACRISLSLRNRPRRQNAIR
jgi:hypothetical protein